MWASSLRASFLSCWWCLRCPLVELSLPPNCFQFPFCDFCTFPAMGLGLSIYCAVHDLRILRKIFWVISSINAFPLRGCGSFKSSISGLNLHACCLLKPEDDLSSGWVWFRNLSCYICCSLLSGHRQPHVPLCLIFFRTVTGEDEGQGPRLWLSSSAYYNTG